MKSVVGLLAPMFKERGYRKRGNAFNRTANDGIVHVTNFQMWAFNPPGTVEMSGLRPNLYGTFTINLGIYIDDVARQIEGHSNDGSRFVTEYQCHIRSRIGQLLPERADTWWKLDYPTELLGEVVSGALLKFGFPWLAQFASRDQILTCLEATPGSQNIVGRFGPSRITAMRMRLAHNERELGERDLLSYAWDKARTEVGRSDLRFHDLRHTGLTWTSEAGAGVAELMHRGGQSSLAAALRYQHATANRDML